MRYAHIVAGRVSSILLASPSVADEKRALGAQLVASESAEPGDFYDGQNFVTPPPPVNRRIGVSDFMERFTQDELEAIYTAAKSNVKAEVMRDRLFREGGMIDLDSQTIGRALNAMVNAGIITAARRDEILS